MGVAINYLAHFERNPNVCGGEWVIKGTRVPVRTLLASLAEGASIEDNSNEQVWQATQEASRFLITQDLDFADIQRFAPGTHAGILVMRLRSSGRQALLQRLAQVFQDEATETWLGCLIINTERKIRIRHP